MITLEPEDRAVLHQEFIKALNDAGLVVTEKHIAEHGVDFLQKQKAMLGSKYISAYNVAKYKLLPGGPTYNTIINMIDDGRIKKDDVIIDKKNTVHLYGHVIRNLRNE